jgi:hypothetical protein
MARTPGAYDLLLPQTVVRPASLAESAAYIFVDFHKILTVSCRMARSADERTVRWARCHPH